MSGYTNEEINAMDSLKLRNLLKSQKNLQANKSLLGKLQDKGVRIHALVKQIEDVLNERKVKCIPEDLNEKMYLNNRRSCIEKDILNVKVCSHKSGKIEILDFESSLKAANRQRTKDDNNGYSYVEGLLHSVQCISSDEDSEQSNLINEQSE